MRRDDVEWDLRKAEANLRKHGVEFEDAVLALEDELAVTVNDLHLVGEERFVTVGMAETRKLLVVVHTPRNQRLRIISARPATRAERRAYEEEP